MGNIEALGAVLMGGISMAAGLMFIWSVVTKAHEKTDAKLDEIEDKLTYHIQRSKDYE